MNRLNSFHANHCKCVSIWRTGPREWTVAMCDEPHQGFRDASFRRYANALHYAKQSYPGVDIWKENRNHFKRVHTA